jgi:hypothetical protein
MKPSIEHVRGVLLGEQAMRQKRQDQADAYGRFGEIVVEAWLRERKHLEVLPFPQTPETKREYLSGDGKRPDFLVTIPAGGPSEKVDVLIDAKFHTIAEGAAFYVGKAEMVLYQAAMAEWGAEWLFFAVINANEPTALHLIERSEMTPSGDASRYEYVLGSIADRSESLTASDLDLALGRFTREGFERSLLPNLPPASAGSA